jgi:hypothetical protein
VLYSCGTDKVENTSHMIAKHCLDVTSLLLRGSVFAGPLPRRGLHNTVVPLLHACITYKQLFLWLYHSCMEQICHNIYIYIYIYIEREREREREVMTALP